MPKVVKALRKLVPTGFRHVPMMRADNRARWTALLDECKTINQLTQLRFPFMLSDKRESTGAPLFLWQDAWQARFDVINRVCKQVPPSVVASDQGTREYVLLAMGSGAVSPATLSARMQSDVGCTRGGIAEALGNLWRTHTYYKHRLIDFNARLLLESMCRAGLLERVELGEDERERCYANAALEWTDPQRVWRVPRHEQFYRQPAAAKH